MCPLYWQLSKCLCCSGLARWRAASVRSFTCSVESGAKRTTTPSKDKWRPASLSSTMTRWGGESSTETLKPQTQLQWRKVCWRIKVLSYFSAFPNAVKQGKEFLQQFYFECFHYLICTQNWKDFTETTSVKCIRADASSQPCVLFAGQHPAVVLSHTRLLSGPGLFFFAGSLKLLQIWLSSNVDLGLLLTPQISNQVFVWASQ